MQPARGEVGGNQHTQLPALEIRERAGTVRLALVAVDRLRGDPVARELLRQAVGPVFGAREDQHLLPGPGGDEVRKQLALLRLGHWIRRLGDQIGGRVAPRHLDHGGIAQEVLRQVADLGREGGREQQVLALARQQAQDATNVADEAHVEHAIRLVEHEYLYPAQIDRLLLHVIQQTAGGRHYDLDTAPERRT